MHVPFGDDESLSKVGRKGFDFFMVSWRRNFLDELQLDIKYDRSYFDKGDGLPVSVLKITTSEVAKDHKGNIHAGALCTMFDHLSTLGVFADPNWWTQSDPNSGDWDVAPHIANRIGLELGLSRNIKVHIQKPVVAGSKVFFVTKILENSPRGTYFFSQIFNDQGELLASGHHDKVKLTKVVKPKL